MNVRSKLFLLIIIVCICILSVDRLHFISDALHNPSHGFVTYYTASYVIAEGENATQLYDDPWFDTQVSQFTPYIQEIYTPNPPAIALMLLPLAHLSHEQARIIWIVFNLLMVIGAIGWIVWMERYSPALAALAILLVLVYQPLYANIKYGQVYGLIFVAVTVIWYAYKHHRFRLAGGLLSIIFIMKTAGLMLFPFLLIKRRWKALIWSAIAGIALVGLTLPLSGGFDSWVILLQKLPVYSQRPAMAVSAYQSVSGFFKHQFYFHPVWNPSPLMDLPMLSTILTAMTLLTLLLVTLWQSRHDIHAKWTFCAMLILGIVVSPATLDYHFMLLLLPILLLLGDHQQMKMPQKILFILVIVCLSVDYPYQHEMYSQSLMAYPKLIGSLLCWGLVIQMMPTTEQKM